MKQSFFFVIFILPIFPLLIVYFIFLHYPINGLNREMNKTASSLFSVVYVTCPSTEVGKRIAREIVRQRLAACVNVSPQLTSIYEWKGKVEEENEAMLIIKTSSDRLSPLKEAVLKMHPYEVPEFIAFPIDYGSEPYLKWIREQTREIDESSAKKDEEKNQKNP